MAPDDMLWPHQDLYRTSLFYCRIQTRRILDLYISWTSRGRKISNTFALLPPLSSSSNLPSTTPPTPPTNQPAMDAFSFFDFAAQYPTTTGSEVDIPVEFETTGKTSGGGCVIA